MANTRVTTPVTDFDKSTSLPGLKIPSGDNSNQPAGAAAEQGMIRNDNEETVDSSASAIAHYNGTAWQYFAATESVDPDPAFSVRYLVIAGGGGGGNYYYGGGGGAGGFRTSFGTGNVNGGLTPVESYLQGAANVNYTVTVGTAGNAQSSGQSSSLVLTSTITTTGGGAGGTQNIGLTGGSGGGGANYPSNYNGGAANTSPVQGFSGGNAVNSTYNAGAGGGGAGEIGTGGAATTALGGKGGDGIESLITGTAAYYAGGGGGGLNRNGAFFTPQGGLGGGGNGAGSTSIAVSGTNGLGGGGGGGSHASYGTAYGASGGSGVVILRYPVGNSINIISGTSPIAADLNAAVAGSTTEKFTRFTATGAVTFTIS
jgi:hypothetical protein